MLELAEKNAKYYFNSFLYDLKINSGMEIHACNPRIWEAEAGRSITSSKPAI
jgi:hypothetical protein